MGAKVLQLEIPVAPLTGPARQHVDIKLTLKQAQAMRAVWEVARSGFVITNDQGLQRPVVAVSDVIRWLLDEIADEAFWCEAALTRLEKKEESE